MSADPDPDEDPKFVTALSRGLRILRAFDGDTATLSNLALSRRTGLPKPTITRLTYTLCRLGYLVQVEAGGAYRLGPGVLALGYGALAALDLRERAALELAAICAGDNPNVAAGLGERHQLSVVYLVTHRAPQSVAMTFHLGARVPLFTSSIGRAILVALPEAERAALLERACHDLPVPEADRLAEGLARAVEDHARHGFCTSFGEWRAEINGIAAPVGPMADGRLYAINVGGFAFLNPATELVARHGPRLLRAASALALKPVTEADAEADAGS